MNPPASQSRAIAPVAFEDGLGERLYAVGAANEPLEVLKISTELSCVSNFEAALRDQTAHLADFQHEAFGRVRAIERLDARSSTIVVISDHVRGVRLSDVLAVARKRAIVLEYPAAAWLTRQLVSAIAAFHDSAPGVCHGAIGPERLVVTPDGRLVVVEYVLGPALEEMHFSWERYWRELGIALPRPIGLPHFDQTADMTQVAAVALALLLGRPLAADEYPHKIADVLDSVTARQADGSDPLPPPIRTWMRCALHLEPRLTFDSAIDALAELDRILDVDEAAGRASVRSFLSRYAAAMALERQTAAPKADTPADAHASATVVPSIEAAPNAGTGPAALPDPIALATPVLDSDDEPEANEPAPWDAGGVDGALSLGADGDDLAAGDADQRGVDDEADAVDSQEPQHSASSPIASFPTAVPAVRAVPPAVASVAPITARASAAQMRPPAPPTGPWSEPAPVLSSIAATKGIEMAHAETPASESKQDEPFAAEAAVVATRSRPAWQSPWAVAAVLALIAGTMGVTMLGRRPVAAAPAATATGTLEIGTNPDGVAVFIDGSDRGRTPLSIQLAPGAHLVELVTDSERRKVPVTMKAGTHMSHFIEMPKGPAGEGDLQVRTEPAKAKVTVDGQLFGRSPVTVKGLAAGTHRVVLENEFGTFTDDVVIEAGGTASLVVPMTKSPSAAANLSGWIAISAPSDLQVYEGGRLVGSSRTDRIMVAVGRHDLELVNEALGYRAAKTVEVAAGQVAAVKPDWPKGTMALNALPWAEVSVDGERVGETPIGGFSLPIGTHDIVFRHPELGERRTTATVTTGAPTRVSMDMRAK
jgi:hypothetical protein